MSDYTITMREYCLIHKITKSELKKFLFDFNYKNWSEKDSFENRFIDFYFDNEIGYLTIIRFKERLAALLPLIANDLENMRRLNIKDIDFTSMEEIIESNDNENRTQNEKQNSNSTSNRNRSNNKNSTRTGNETTNATTDNKQSYTANSTNSAVTDSNTVSDNDTTTTNLHNDQNLDFMYASTKTVTESDNETNLHTDTNNTTSITSSTDTDNSTNSNVSASSTDLENINENEKQDSLNNLNTDLVSENLRKSIIKKTGRTNLKSDVIEKIVSLYKNLDKIALDKLSVLFLKIY